MNDNKIKCTECGEEIELSAALTKDLEKSINEAAKEKYEQEKQDYAKKVQERANEQLEAERAKAVEAASKKVEAELKLAEEDSKARDLQIADMTKQMSDLTKDLRESRQLASQAELNAQKKLSEEEGKIREEAEKAANENSRLKQLELEKKLADTQKSLDEANRKANQGSQQNQGEVLELELERMLGSEFPLDELDEVKKGARGADIKQTVKNESLQTAGLLLWETKNGKWQPAWVPKFKNDIREANANIGVIVSQEIPPEFGDMENLEKNIWVVKPPLAVVLASALRSTILQVDEMSKMNVGKDVKMEALFGFISGPEFKHRVEAIVEHYGALQQEIEKEKRSAQLRWSKQEKSIRAVIDNTIGMYGDLQGITNSALPTIKSLGLEEGEVSDQR